MEIALFKKNRSYVQTCAIVTVLLTYFIWDLSMYKW